MTPLLLISGDADSATRPQIPNKATSAATESEINAINENDLILETKKPARKEYQQERGLGRGPLVYCKIENSDKFVKNLCWCRFLVFGQKETKFSLIPMPIKNVVGLMPFSVRPF